MTRLVLCLYLYAVKTLRKYYKGQQSKSDTSLVLFEKVLSYVTTK